MIALAYLLIPLALATVWRQRSDLPFSWMFVLFGIFIVACGATHVMEVWNVWNANYWFSGGVKLVTAVASVPTAILLIRSLPKIRAIPTEKQLATTNRRLERALEELEQFSYAVSHDLRAPLRSMDGFSQAIVDRYEDVLDDKNGKFCLSTIR